MNENLNADNVNIDLEKLSEGLRLTAYRDDSPKHIWTIGYGHAGPDAHAGLVITAEQAEALLRADVRKAVDGVKACVGVALNAHQFSALVDFAFNVGLEALRTSTLLRKLNAGDYAGADAEFKKWDHAGDKVLPGLTKRRGREADLFATPEDKPWAP